MHVVVVGLGYGDEGKGATVDWLCRDRRAHTVVRFNGGAQAAHHVVLPDGRSHRFAQFGSGTFAGAITFLSRFMLVDPLRLVPEAAHLAELGVEDPFSLLMVDEDAPLITPWHREANRAREAARGDRAHGSCGVGVGETARYLMERGGDAPRCGDCADIDTLGDKLALLERRILDEFPGLAVPTIREYLTECEAFDRVVGPFAPPDYLPWRLDRGVCVFEGAQGVLLDEWHGFHPYTTWSTTTTANANELLDGAEAERLGVVRSYTTRHGAGPFVTEDADLDMPEAHNDTGRWQGRWRVGHFDAVAHRYAADVCGDLDGIVVNHLDRVRPGLRICVDYEPTGLFITPVPDLCARERATDKVSRVRPVYEPAGESMEFQIAEAMGLPLALLSMGPTFEHRLPLTTDHRGTRLRI